MAKRIAGTVELASPGHGTKESGTGPRVVITGAPGELTLFGAGRQGAARVEMTGDSQLVAQLRTASLGI